MHMHESERHPWRLTFRSCETSAINLLSSSNSNRADSELRRTSGCREKRRTFSILSYCCNFPFQLFFPPSGISSFKFVSVLEISVLHCLNSTMVLWVFGYGSLVWNPGFDFDERMIGFIRDYRRVFDLACIDHRGTPENPARTLTLEPDEGSICWGAAYCIRGGPERERVAMEYLERRECEYDEKTIVNFYKDEDSIEPTLKGVLVFTSTPDKLLNKYYLGPAPLEEMASQIATASGPCGNNRDYLFRLEKALFDIGHEEDMVIELANEVRSVLGKVRKGMVILKEKKKAVGSTTHLPFMSFISGVQVHPLAEAAVAMDSYKNNGNIGVMKGES